MITAEITAWGDDGSVESDVSYDGTLLGSVTLALNEDYELDIVEDDTWADADLQEWLERPERSDHDHYDGRVCTVLRAVRTAAEDQSDG